MKKSIILLLIFTSYIYAAQKVLVTNKNFQYKEIINLEDLQEKTTYKALNRNCTALESAVLKEHQYIALHYIRKGSVICTKDVEKYIRRSVKFNFGSFEIEKVGEVIQENDDFVKIKTRDGKVEKIYKDGHSR